MSRVKVYLNGSDGLGETVVVLEDPANANAMTFAMDLQADHGARAVFVASQWFDAVGDSLPIPGEGVGVTDWVKCCGAPGCTGSCPSCQDA